MTFYHAHLHSIWISAIFVTLLVTQPTKAKVDPGSLTCTNGAWIPDGKLIAFGLSCPLPLDGKSKSKGKTAVCAMKKVGVWDGKTMKRDQIAPELCQVFKPDKIKKQCEQKVATCLQNGKGYFQDPKTDTEYKSWSQPYECIEKWTKKACKK